GGAEEMPEHLRRVGDRIAPAVVRIQHGDGHGTGFLIDARGYVLTNAHVSCSPLPAVVQVTHRAPAGWSVLTYRKVLLAGFHPTLDLALLKIDPEEHGRPLTAVKLSEQPPAVGAAVYTMGYPGDIAGGKQKILSDGRILTLDRMIHRRKYLETDASVAQGNSGGPVCIDSGEVVGVLTLKRSPEETGLAVPIWALRLGSFVPLHQRPRDAAAAIGLLREAEKCLDRARGGDPRYRDLGLALYEEASIVDVGNPEIYFKLGVAHGEAGRPRTAAAYLTRALQISPWSKGCEPYAALAGTLETMGRKDETFVVLQEGLWKHPEDAPRLLGPLSKAAVAARRPVDACFYAHLGRHMELYRAVRERLSEEERSELDRRESRGPEWLELRRRAAEHARQEGRAVLTPEFETFMRTFEGVQREGTTAQLTRFDDDRVRHQADRMSKDDVSALFVRAQLKLAVAHLEKGRRDLAEAILREIVRDYPDSHEASEARRLLPD
ncbi:MAG TPA: trypsin-like peptidase domain-containing protein, partial [Planctomycetota bacterium]|nr:trypsin-like peptidase domain-containing protein [Planctomycetota bacterium]